MELLLQGGNIQVSLSSPSSPVLLISPYNVLIKPSPPTHPDCLSGGNAFNKELKTPGWQKPLTSFFTVSNLILAFFSHQSSPHFFCYQSHPSIFLPSIFSTLSFRHLISQNVQRDPNAPPPKQRTEEEEEEYQLMKAKLAGNISLLQ